MSSLPASMKRIGSKATEKRWRHSFPHYKSMGAFCCHGNQSFDPICPKTLCSLSPTPVMLHIKFDQDWPTGFRDIQVWKCGRRRRTIGIQAHLVSLRLRWAKNEHVSLETPFSPLYVYGKFLDAQGRSDRNLNLSKILCLSSLCVSLTKIISKLKVLALRHRFPPL